MSFGSKRERHERCSVAHAGVETKDHKHIELKLLSVEHICEPITNNTLDFNRYPYLKRLDLAFDFSNNTSVEPDILLVQISIGL